MMHPGSTIHVANFTLFKATSTKFNRCGLFNEMYNGMITTWGSQLDFNNNTISDANIGIYCYPNSNITQLIQNKFNRCYIGIEAYEIISERPFVGNRFYSDGTLLPPKSGFPFAGMRIINTNGLISERSGFYEHMNWGIELYNSNYIGENISMQNGPTVITMLNPGIGIISRGSNFTIKNSYFRRIPFGIWSDQGSSSTITDNHFMNISFGVLVQNSPNLTINIHNNMMDTIRTWGIFIKDCAPHLETLVSDNMVVFSSSSLYGQPTESCFGITLDNDGDRIEAGRETQIFNNHVYQNTASPPTSFFGYFLYNTWSILCDNNTFDFGIPYSNQAWGFYVNNCSRVNLNANTITGGGNNHPSSTGIYLHQTHFSNLCCNTTSGIDVGTEFDGVCLDTRIRGSNFDGPYTTNAMLFFFTITAIQQLYPGNDWEGSAPMDARYVGDPSTAFEDRFVISTTGLPFHPDDPIDGPSGWFDVPMNPDPESTCFQDENCDAIPETSCDDFPNDSLLLVSGYGGLHNEGLTWEARKTVLREFWKDPDFGCNFSMSSNFKTAHQNSNLGKLAQITNDISSMLTIPVAIAENLEDLSNTINLETQAITSIDAWWEEEGADLVYWKQQRDIHVVNLLDAITQYDSILAVIYAEVLAAIPSIQSDLGEIIPQNIMEENELYVTAIFLDKLVDPEYSLDSIQTQNLTSIANQCPLDGGSAVIRARAMLWCPELENLHHGATCSGIFGPRSENENADAFDFEIMPNPNQGNFELKIENHVKHSQYTIRVFDAQGKVIKNMNTKQQSNILDLTRNPGIYFINVLRTDGTSYTKKLFII